MLAKKKAEEQAEVGHRQLEQAGHIISRLETEKNDLHDRVAELDVHMAEVERSRSQRSQVEESLNQEIKMLKSHLSLKERKLLDLEVKLLRTDQDLDIKLANTTKDLQGTKKQVKDLLEENRQIRQQMSELASTSTSFEDLIRRKDSELAILKTDLRKYQDDRKRFEGEKQILTSKHEEVQDRLRQVQAEVEAMHSLHTQLQREADDAKRALEDRTSENAKAVMLEGQIEDLKSELYQVQTELSRERQSRDDVKKICDSEVAHLRREFDALNDSKVTIEKEMYVQSDVTRRATEAKVIAEKERKEYQQELQDLRKKFIALQEAKIESEAAVERSISRQANERQAILRRDIEAKGAYIAELDQERGRLATEVQQLKQLIADSDTYKIHHDQHKERLERELVTVKGRLTASENDNRALLNKVQQKNLDIARSNSRVGDSQRTRIAQLTAEKSRAEDETKKVLRQLEGAQLNITSLEKQKEKLALSLEDLDHEVSREHRTTRNAEQASSTTNLQLADANRKLETERQLRTQAQANTRTIQNALDASKRELEECHEQLMLLQKGFDPEVRDMQMNLDGAKPDFSRTIDLAQKLETSQQALRLATERCSRAEAQLEDLRLQHQDEMQENDVRYTNSKRALLEEMNGHQVNARSSPIHFRGKDRNERKPFSPINTPSNQRHISNTTNDSAKSDRTNDTVAYNNRMDIAAELELVQNQLQMSEMRNRHLQAQVERSPTKNAWQDESPSNRRVQKLERENFRLHDMLDDSAKKVSVLENSIRTGQLSLKEVQTKSHEELYDLFTSQEHSRKSLLQSHNAAIAELAEAKASFEDVKQARTSLEVELRDARSELCDLASAREQEAASHAQLLQEFSDLQIRLDTETSKLEDVTASMNLYKARSDEYFGKLEQAEIAVLKASRAEQFAKTQARDAEDTCATIMSERKQMDMMVEDLQRQAEQYEERLEDLAADLDGAVQARRRLQNELEDYRSQRAMDIEDKETSMEQTRKKYQSELATLNNELDIERENVIHAKGENGRLRDELEELRSKWDDEVLNSSTWAKEKSRLEVTMQDLSDSRDEVVNAHNEAQSRIVSLLSQVRSLRTNVDDIAAERDLLVREKKGLDARLREAGERLDALASSGSPSKRSAASMDRELLELKSSLAQQEDIAAAAVGKMRRTEALAQEIQRDIMTERETGVQMHKEKAALEKTVKDLQLRLIDLETKGYSSASQDVRFLHGRIQELETALETLEATRTRETRSVRTVDRTVRDLHSQLSRRDKSLAQTQDDLSKSRDKIANLLAAIDELQSSDSANQLAAKRAERELREEREAKLRLERELEGWKGLRTERDGVRRSVHLALGSDAGRQFSSRGGSVEPSLGIEVPQRKSSLTKGFL
ncbi:class II myosin [Elasticomyces elasticus]|nr:class II myosin [Elasticomyces elasticus]